MPGHARQQPGIFIKYMGNVLEVLSELQFLKNIKEAVLIDENNFLVFLNAL